MLLRLRLNLDPVESKDVNHHQSPPVRRPDDRHETWWPTFTNRKSTLMASEVFLPLTGRLDGKQVCVEELTFLMTDMKSPLRTSSIIHRPDDRHGCVGKAKQHRISVTYRISSVKIMKALKIN
ncbi:hypothetical protein RIR_jg20649.t1 [Rhizophagus irregularis DAOM 181602=DAOM 197198]|nr:hypothetical protein RIR_jg20649.t1 [Rhizophagus irregularis DAOM 181602=DAOM 197198]